MSSATQKQGGKKNHKELDVVELHRVEYYFFTLNCNDTCNNMVVGSYRLRAADDVFLLGGIHPRWNVKKTHLGTFLGCDESLWDSSLPRTSTCTKYTHNTNNKL